MRLHPDHGFYVVDAMMRFPRHPKQNFTLFVCPPPKHTARAHMQSCVLLGAWSKCAKTAHCFWRRHTVAIVGISEFGSLGVSTPHLVTLLFGSFLVYTVAIFVVTPHLFVTLHHHELVRPRLGRDFPQLWCITVNPINAYHRLTKVNSDKIRARNNENIER